jgi:hypothetical protein
VLATVDIGVYADHAQRQRLRVAQHHLSPAEDPLPAAILAAQAVFVVHRLRLAAHVLVQRIQCGRLVPWVNEPEPCRVAAVDVLVAITEHALPGWREVGLSGLTVPVPDTIAGALQSEMPAPLAGLQLFLAGLQLALAGAQLGRALLNQAAGTLPLAEQRAEQAGRQQAGQATQHKDPLADRPAMWVGKHGQRFEDNCVQAITQRQDPAVLQCADFL